MHANLERRLSTGATRHLVATSSHSHEHAPFDMALARAFSPFSSDWSRCGGARNTRRVGTCRDATTGTRILLSNIEQ